MLPVTRRVIQDLTVGARGGLRRAGFAALDVSTDFLLFEGVVRGPLQVPDDGIAERQLDPRNLGEGDRKSLFHIPDALVTKTRVRSIAGRDGVGHYMIAGAPQSASLGTTPSTHSPWAASCATPGSRPSGSRSCCCEGTRCLA